MPELRIWTRFFRRHWFNILLALFVAAGLGSVIFPEYFPDWFNSLVEALGDS